MFIKIQDDLINLSNIYKITIRDNKVIFYKNDEHATLYTLYKDEMKQLMADLSRFNSKYDKVHGESIKLA